MTIEPSISGRRPGESEWDYTRRILGCPKCGAIGAQYARMGPDGGESGCSACGDKMTWPAPKADDPPGVTAPVMPWAY